MWLKSGGYIVINPTEALVAIDVNTGRFVGRDNLEDTVLRTNLEAVQEIVRQIRLRDLGGIIVIDLIDMIEQEHREEVFARSRPSSRGTAQDQVLNISEFGLVEITRKRSRANLERLLTQPCPYCGGRGRMKSTTTICLNLRASCSSTGAARRAAAGSCCASTPRWRGAPGGGAGHPRRARAPLGVKVLLQSDPGSTTSGSTSSRCEAPPPGEAANRRRFAAGALQGELRAGLTADLAASSAA